MWLDRPRTGPTGRREFVRRTPARDRHAETTRQLERVRQRRPRRRPPTAFPEALHRPSSPSTRRRPVQQATDDPEPVLSVGRFVGSQVVDARGGLGFGPAPENQGALLLHLPIPLNLGEYRNKVTRSARSHIVGWTAEPLADHHIVEVGPDDSSSLENTVENQPRFKNLHSADEGSPQERRPHDCQNGAPNHSLGISFGTRNQERTEQTDRGDRCNRDHEALTKEGTTQHDRIGRRGEPGLGGYSGR